MGKIMFLEDELMIREVISEYLKIAGYDVMACDHGQTAIELIDQHPFDIAILDIKVPGPSGIEVLEYIRQSAQSDMGVIMLTAFEDEATQLEAFNHFSDDYVTKPTSPILLLKRLEVLLNRLDKRTTAQVSGLTIDRQASRVFFNGQDLQLTLTEFLIVKTLNDYPHKVFSRENLIQSVFGDDYFGSDRIIDAHIKNIRKKIPIKVIKTMIGLGYRWEEYHEA